MLVADKIHKKKVLQESSQGSEKKVCFAPLSRAASEKKCNSVTIILKVFLLKSTL